MGIHTVFSIDGSLHHRWQADLLAYSHRKVRQPGPLTRLWSANEKPVPFAGLTFQAQPYSPHPISGDIYPPHNKPTALLAWLQENPPIEETILLLDPDCIFMTLCDLEVKRDEPVAQPIDWMNSAANAELVKRLGCRPDLVQPMSIPILIHRDDLALLAPKWIELTEAIRNDPVSRQLAGWVAEMWAYALAASQLGLRHQLRDLTRWQMENRADLPLIHYCYASSSMEGQWQWDKRTYRPWERVPDPPPETPLATVILIWLLNELATFQKRD